MTTARIRVGKVRVKAKSRPLVNVVEMTWPADDAVVRLLSEIRELAVSGQVDGVAIAATTRDGGITTAAHAGRKLFPLFGAIVAVENRLRKDLAA